MAVLNLSSIGQSGVHPIKASLYAPEKTIAQVTASGYISTLLNGNSLISGDYVFCTCSDGNIMTTASVSAGVRTLNVFSNSGEVTYSGSAPTIGQLPAFADVNGNITKTTITWLSEILTIPGIINASGNITAGDVSGTAGAFTTYGGVASKGALRIQATSNTNNDVVTITNAAHGQATAYTVHDVGVLTGKLIVSSNIKTQFVYTSVNIGGHGTAAFSQSGTGTPAGVAVCSIFSSSNNVAPPRVDASVANQLSFQFSADPGANVIVTVLVVTV